MKQIFLVYLDHHLEGRLIARKSERKLLVEVVHVLGTDSFAFIFSINSSLLADHHHIENIDIVKINDITVIGRHTIIERKINNIVRVRLQVKTSEFLLSDSFLRQYLSSSHSSTNHKHVGSSKDANNNNHHRSHHHSSHQTNGVSSSSSSSSHRKFNSK